MIGFLISEIGETAALVDLPELAGEKRIAFWGGSLGLLVGCVFRIGEESDIEEMFDLIVRLDNPEKMSVLLSQALYMNKQEELLRIIDRREQGVASDEIRTLLSAWVAKDMAGVKFMPWSLPSEWSGVAPGMPPLLLFD